MLQVPSFRTHRINLQQDDRLPEDSTASRNATRPEKKPVAPTANKTNKHHTEAARNRIQNKKEQRKLYSEAITNRKPLTKKEIRKTLEENSTKAETELQLVRTNLENDHKQAMEKMKEHLKMEEGVYVFVASLTLLI